MKWRLIIPIWTFVCVSLTSSAPIFVQNEMAVMYPMEYYPYMQSDFNLDFTKWFRKAADSVKHFYNFVNNLIFGEIAREPIFRQYPAFKETADETNESHTGSTVHPQELEANVHGIQVFEIYKDEDGKLFMKNLNDPNGNLQPLRNVPIKSITELKKPENSPANVEPQTNGKVAWNSFQWNKNFDNDKLFAGAFQNYPVNPQLLWHSGIFSFQPLSAFNVMSGKVLDQNQVSQDQSSQSPSTSVSEITSQNIDVSEPSSTSASTTVQPEPETTTITEEETKQDETSDNSNSSNNEKLTISSDGSSLYEVVMEVERLKQNNSNSDKSSNANQSESEPESTQGSDIFDETNDEDDTDNNDTETDDNNNDDDDDDLSDFATEPIFSDNESDLGSQEPEPETTKESTQELSGDRSTIEKDDSDSTIVETSSPTEATEKTEITEKFTVAEITEETTITEITEKTTITEIAEETSATENPEINLPVRDSDESDIAKKVLAIVQPSEN